MIVFSSVLFYVEDHHLILHFYVFDTVIELHDIYMTLWLTVVSHGHVYFKGGSNGGTIMLWSCCFLFFILDELFFNYSFVQLKINNQALDSAHAPVSPGEVFKVYGSKD